MQDRFFDSYIHQQMQKIVGDHRRPADQKDAMGTTQAKALIRTAYGLVEEAMATRQWAMGDAYTMADCAASPALFYANKVVPLGDFPNTKAYLQRLSVRPSFARVLKEAEPYFHMFPVKD
jgi:glutathione S-transferase